VSTERRHILLGLALGLATLALSTLVFFFALLRCRAENSHYPAACGVGDHHPTAFLIVLAVVSVAIVSLGFARLRRLVLLTAAGAVTGSVVVYAFAVFAT
jgi:hypothetical protein